MQEEVVSLNWWNPWHWPALLRGEPWHGLYAGAIAKLAQLNIHLQKAHAMNLSLAERVHGQSEILSRHARGEPAMVCLVFSEVFDREYQMAFYEEEQAGHIVLSRACFEDGFDGGEELQLRRIEMASEVLVIAPHKMRCTACGKWFLEYTAAAPYECPCGGYRRPQRFINDEMARGIEHACKLGKLIRYYESKETVRDRS